MRYNSNNNNSYIRIYNNIQIIPGIEIDIRDII